MINHPEDTIAATVTAPGEAGIAVVRVSGPEALRIGDAAFQSVSGRKASETGGGSFLYGQVVDANGSDLDEALLLIMKSPHSFTAEDVIEIQGHGGSWCAKRILRRVVELGARIAEPGEFSRRAFLNGRIDLLQAEAVLDLIKARSERAAAAALEQLEGGLSASFGEIFEDLILLAADIEATLDFTEEELPHYVMKDLRKRLTSEEQKIIRLISTWDEGHLLRDGVVVVIAGRPNAGKSTLLNALLERDRAIVSAIPGTTRDSIEEEIILNGIPVRLLDPAGLRSTEDLIEKEGIHRTHKHTEAADIILYLVDSQEVATPDDLASLQNFSRERTLILRTKTDLGPTVADHAFAEFRQLEVSLLPNENLDSLKKELAERLSGDADLQARPHAVISERHRELLDRSRKEIRLASACLESGRDEQVPLASVHIRQALESIGEVTGKEYNEALLDNIFSRFCVGK
jgi:tRNA modification GTPase